MVSVPLVPGYPYRYAPPNVNHSILNAFLKDQRYAKSIVASHLNIRQDTTALDWATRLAEIRAAYQLDPFADVFKPHGYGLELQIGNLYIDYDYSESGRPDGFDAWRIFVYITAGKFDNTGADKHITERVHSWFDELIQTGQIAKLDNLYYLNGSAKNGA